MTAVIIRLDARRGMQDEELDQLAEMLADRYVGDDEELWEFVRQRNRLHLEILRGCVFTPDGFVQVFDDGSAVN